MINQRIPGLAKKLVCGVGVNDADYPVMVWEPRNNGKRKLKWRCPFYEVWLSMIHRCYSGKSAIKQPTYVHCSICDEWLYFSKFKAWMEQQDWEGKELDKDILVPGNKEYNQDRCVFISSRVNSFIIETNTARGEWPIGVYQDKYSGKFIGMCRGLDSKQVHLGTFLTPAEAHEAWRKFKLCVAKEIAKELEGFVADALVDRYEKYDTYFTHSS